MPVVGPCWSGDFRKVVSRLASHKSDDLIDEFGKIVFKSRSPTLWIGAARPGSRRTSSRQLSRTLSHYVFGVVEGAMHKQER